MFEECRIEGEFNLTSGRVSNVFYDFDLLLPSEAVKYAQDLINQIPDDTVAEVDFIATPAVGGIIPAFLSALAMGKPLVILDKEGVLRGPEFQVGKYLIVDDVVTSFGSANKVVSALEGMEVLGVAAYVFRGSLADIKKQSYPIFYLSRKEQEL